MPSSHSGTVATSSAAGSDGTLFSPPTIRVVHRQQDTDDAGPIQSALAGQRELARD